MAWQQFSGTILGAPDSDPEITTAGQANSGAERCQLAITRRLPPHQTAAVGGFPPPCEESRQKKASARALGDSPFRGSERSGLFPVTSHEEARGLAGLQSSDAAQGKAGGGL